MREDLNKEIGRRIKNRRLKLNMSQDELAQKCGYKSRSSINKLELAENSGRSLPFSKLEVLARALDVSIEYLMPSYSELSHLSDKIGQPSLKDIERRLIKIEEVQREILSILKTTSIKVELKRKGD